MLQSYLHTRTAHPLHVAVIPDGNGRWATARGLPRTAGHVAGMEAIRRGWSNRLCWHWDTVLKPIVTNPSKPEGLDGFLAEVGL